MDKLRQLTSHLFLQLISAMHCGRAGPGGTKKVLDSTVVRPGQESFVFGRGDLGLDPKEKCISEKHLKISWLNNRWKAVRPGFLSY